MTLCSFMMVEYNNSYPPSWILAVILDFLLENDYFYKNISCFVKIQDKVA